ncbi:hypothetical protein J6590_082599 [Homalodisca vitripennis]|nr:hypothetical protein J6590_095504 [Homalodisca vitripennis]KAG8261058.1 hypothetical protein J6590_082599 [Homalodisca vitripennis]
MSHRSDNLAVRPAVTCQILLQLYSEKHIYMLTTHLQIFYSQLLEPRGRDRKPIQTSQLQPHCQT